MREIHLSMDFTDIEGLSVDAEQVVALLAALGDAGAVGVNVIYSAAEDLTMAVGMADGVTFGLACVEGDNDAPCIAFLERLSATLQVRGLIRQERIK